MSASTDIAHHAGLDVVGQSTPATIDDLKGLVADLYTGEDAIAPTGGGTALAYGPAIAKRAHLVDTTGLATIVDYPSEDLTITLEAGITIKRLNEVLAEKGQFLPLDVPFADRATLGGVLATNTAGPRRQGYGTARDYVIGIDVVGAEGRRIHGGGRVVKNVAGYDFMKLHVGALGTLGIIAEVTLKLHPLPGQRGGVWASLRDDQLQSLLERLHQTQTRPVATTLVNESGRAGTTPWPGEPSPWSLVVLFEESSAAVAWQTEQLRRELADAAIDQVGVLPSEQSAPLLDWLTHWPAAPERTDVLKASLLPSDLATICSSIPEKRPGTGMLIDAGTGITHVDVSGGGVTAIADVRQEVVELGGHAVLIQTDEDRGSRDLVWGSPRDDVTLMRRLKEAWDPRDLFNPGKMP
ncbi:putative FAD-linked oxidoreductase [Planctomycetes bacterium Pan216]|uniref:Putative FAD-linked oxidoreductase n=1 Tax=Kolteria novifilia TaxID=2527975 RepID=A0A518AZE5_9BACT|nr:putative FAD-linked oxidoreductase [Planctomycetes bacterium Pan216]